MNVLIISVFLEARSYAVKTSEYHILNTELRLCSAAKSDNIPNKKMLKSINMRVKKKSSAIFWEIISKHGLNKYFCENIIFNLLNYGYTLDVVKKTLSLICFLNIPSGKGKW